MNKKKEPAEIENIKNICEVMSTKKKGSICDKIKNDEIITPSNKTGKKDKE